MKPKSILLFSILYLFSSLVAGCGQNGNKIVSDNPASTDANHKHVADPNDWPRWRGPEQNGLSRQKNLPSEWAPPSKQNPQGKNIIWTNDIGGMSSPIVMNGRLYTLSRTGEIHTGDATIPSEHAQETFVCVDFKTGKTIWEHKENMTQTDVPFWRIGWSNPVGDPTTNRVYALGAQCTFLCLDATDGNVIWKRQMTEEFGLISTFGGRTPSPAIDEDQIFITGVAFGWGDNARGQHRVFAFNKNTGQLNWTSGTGYIPTDAPQNTPVITVIDGKRLIVLATGDGGIHAWNARTGEKQFHFYASKRGMNSSLVVDGTRIFCCSDLDNFDSTRLGRISCIDAAGADMKNPPKEIWRQDGVEAGFPSPTISDGILYVADNFATIYAIDTNHPLETTWPGTQVKKAKVLWKKSFGRIGKGSPVFADGKIYFGEANGRVSIIKAAPEGPQILSQVELSDKPGREYVIYGSPAIAQGRVIIQAASKTYCIGNKDSQVASDPIPAPPAEPAADKNAQPAFIQVVPADVLLHPGQKQKFTARAFDKNGRFLKEVEAQWSIDQLKIPPPPQRVPENIKNPNASDVHVVVAAAPAPVAADARIPVTTQPAPPPGPVGNLKGELAKDGTFAATDAGHQAGGVYATVGGVKGFARVRVLPPLPWKFDFEQARVNAPPFTWTGAGGKFSVQDQGGNKVLTKLTDIPLYARARTNFGSVDMSNYTLQADVKVKETIIGEGDHPIHKMPDAGIINQRYVLELLGTDQKAVLHIWPTALPYSLNHTIDYQWQAEKWYRLKLEVTQASDKAVIKGKVWPADQNEPSEWIVHMEDTIPNRNGNPGLWGFSNDHEIYYDNIQVTENKP